MANHTGKGQFKKGEAKGRPKGVPNKITRTVKETVSAVFNSLQENPDGKSDLESWARQRPGDFYQVAAKLIPTEIAAKIEDVTPQQEITLPGGVIIKI